VNRGLGAKTAVLRAAAGFHIDDRTQAHPAAVKVLANTVRPDQQIEPILRARQRKQPLALRPGDATTGQDSLAQFGDAAMRGRVNQSHAHG